MTNWKVILVHDYFYVALALAFLLENEIQCYKYMQLDIQNIFEMLPPIADNLTQCSFCLFELSSPIITVEGEVEDWIKI